MPPRGRGGNSLHPHFPFHLLRPLSSNCGFMLVLDSLLLWMIDQLCLPAPLIGTRRISARAGQTPRNANTTSEHVQGWDVCVCARDGMAVVSSGSEKWNSGYSPSWGAPSCTGLQLQGSQVAVTAQEGSQTHKQAIIIKVINGRIEACIKHLGNTEEMVSLFIKLYVPPPHSKNDLKRPAKLIAEQVEIR